MREFFKGWRRKAGLVTLAMACALTVAWMRSYLIEDDFVLGIDLSSHNITSLNGGLSWAKQTPCPRVELILWSVRNVADLTPFDGWDVYDYRWRWSCLGFNFGEIRWPHAQPQQIVIWTIPYWSLVLPLTLLSAWLILGKPRKVKPAADFRLPARDESIQ